MPSSVRFLFPAALLLASHAFAADEPAVPDTAPPPPPSASDQEQIEPEVNIIQRDGKTIEEYRVNGKLYMIKVTPKGAPPYYLVDTDGDGSLDNRQSVLDEDLLIPSWVLFRW
ncbi:FIG00953549: hypothetical protein [hydrothermal vent metagenome]|uniref:DUF2782 domain-containing protein n=1 Tax=hydrothermal vent metagenome TaxID=652676 RepID=A0A3B0Y701_9ZZZZ